MTAATPKIEDVITPAARETFAKLQLARVEADRVRSVVDEIAAAYLASNVVLDDDGDRIEAPAALWRAADDAFGTITEELHARQVMNGVKPETMEADYCPALVAESIRTDLETALIRETGGALGLGGATLHGTKRAEWLRLTCSLIEAGA